MRIEMTIDGKVSHHEVEPGVLLSEVLQTEQAVWLEGRLVNAGLMLAAQVHGRSLELRPPVEQTTMMDNVLVPEPSRC